MIYHGLSAPPRLSAIFCFIKRCRKVYGVHFANTHKSNSSIYSDMGILVDTVRMLRLSHLA